MTEQQYDSEHYVGYVVNCVYKTKDGNSAKIDAACFIYNGRVRMYNYHTGINEHRVQRAEETKRGDKKRVFY